MDSRSANRHARLYFARTIELFESRPDGFFQPCCCLAGRCNQRHAKALVSCFLKQLRHNVYDRRGLTCAGSAADNRKLILHRSLDGLGLSTSAGTPRLLRRRRFFAERNGQTLLVVPVATQIQPIRFIENKRRIFAWAAYGFRFAEDRTPR